MLYADYLCKQGASRRVVVNDHLSTIDGYAIASLATLVHAVF